MVVHGVIGGALLMADPGCMLYRAHVGGKAPDSADWKGKEGYVDGTMDAESVRMPSPSQWPEGTAPGQERDGRSYNLISGPYLSALLANLDLGHVPDVSGRREAWFRSRVLIRRP